MLPMSMLPGLLTLSSYVPDPSMGGSPTGLLLAVTTGADVVVPPDPADPGQPIGLLIGLSLGDGSTPTPPSTAGEATGLLIGITKAS